MKLSPFLLSMASCCLCFSACGLFKATKPPTSQAPVPPEGPKLIGRIASIPADKRFVLIQSYGKWNIESGGILTTRGPNDRSANLRTTGESLGEFAAADLQSGVVEVGDAVYSQPIVKSPALLITPEVPQAQLKQTSENVQKNN